jgi:hypothetical protein
MKNKFIGVMIGMGTLLSCTKMDHEYAPYLASGELFYTGTPYELEVHPGRERVEIQFTQSKDPNIVKYTIFWKNHEMHTDVAPDTAHTVQKVIVDHLTEGDYTFEIVAYDKKGNTSTPKLAIVSGACLGASYEANLLVRRAVFSNSRSGVVIGLSSVDSTCKYTEVLYNNTNGLPETKKLVNMMAFSDTLTDIQSTATFVQLKTAYVPEMGIDTFYATQKISLNLVAANYLCTGTMVDYTNAGLTGPYPWNVTLRAVTATQLELVDNDYAHDVYHKILSNGGDSYYGVFGVVFNLDNNYNVISMFNKYGQPSSNGRSGELDPSGINKFDPATRTLKVKYWLNQPGATHRTSFDETFTMK